MRLTLPSAFALFLGCTHAQPRVAPGPPIPAEPEVVVGSMDDECKGLEDALAAYGACPNIEDGERAWVRATIEFAEQSFAAGRKAAPEAPALHAMAVACRKAARSAKYAAIRCRVGPKPRVD